MWEVFYGLIVCFASSVVVYFYCCTSVFLIVLIFSICFLLFLLEAVSVEDFSKVFCKIRNFFISKLQYKELVYKNPGKKKTMSSFRKLSISGQNDCSFDSGLLSDYDSRRSRNSIKYNKSPGNKSLLNTSHDENYISKQSLSTTNNIFSPLRVSGSPLHCSPLSHSKRYNVNLEKERPSTRRSSSRRSLLLEDNLLVGSPKSSTNKDFQTRSFSPSSTVLEKTSSPANRMNVAQFPWISSTGPMIPLIQSPLQSASSPIIGSPQRDSSSNTPKSNRVRVRLTCPSRSDLSITSHDVSSTPDDSCTTKSVIQVLKEISRKRAFMPGEEEEEHEAKRRQEHNLYMSRLEGEESNSIPARTNVDDDRKRTREPDWDSGNIAGPKRRRKNNHIVNNEILSSLSSSIGLRQLHASPVIEKPPKQTVSIGTQVCLLKDHSDKKQNEQSAQTNALKPTKEVKEASTMPDPPPPPRQRSPVKEKVVTDLNGILKSALSKFKIQPKENTNNEASSPLMPSFSVKSGDNSSGITTKASDLTSAQSTIIPTTLTSPSTQTLPLGAQPSFSPQTSNFKLPASTTSNQPPTLFSSPMLSPSNTPKENKITEERVTKPDVQNASNNLEAVNKKDETKSELTGFKISNPVETPSSVSPFKFGQLPNSTPQTTQSSVPTSTPFSFKAQEASSTVSTPDTARPTFSFGSPKTESTVANSTSAITATTPFTSAQVSQANSVAKTTGNEPFKFGTSTFALKEKSSDKNELSKDEKKEAGNVALFSFGKTESKTGVDSDKTTSVNKPFQFGSGGFTFGQTSSQNKEASSPFTQNTTTSSTTTDIAKPVFTFSSNSEKKDEKPGGFSFQLPTCTASAAGDKQNPVFSFSGTQNTPAATTASSIVSTTTSNAKPIFPPSLFGSTNTSTAASNSTAVTTKSIQALPVASSASSTFGSASTFGSTVTEANKTISTTTTTTTASTFASVASTFGSGNKTIFGSTPSSGANTTSLFGTNNVSNTQPVSTSIFGSNMGNNATVFSSTNNKTTTFGAPTTTSSGLTPTFGAPTTTSSGLTPTFGAPTTTSSVLTPTFGATTTTSSVPTFGSAINPNTSFGNPTTTTAPSFGSTGSLSASTSGFGSNTVPTGSSAPTFGSGLATTTAPTFGASSTSTPTFGSVQTTSAPLFGSATATGTTPAFGSGSGNNAVTFGSNTTGSTSTPFGGSTSTPTFGSTATPAFGGSTTAPAFGGSTSTPAFGGSTTTPAFGGNNTTPAFGGNNTTPVFGGSTSSAPAFGSQPQSFGNQTGTTFGSTPAFGQNTSSPSPFGAQSTFGSQTTTPAFGATPAFGSSSSTFSAAPSATAAPAFGSSAPTFGSPATFGAQDANKPFTFNAPSNQPQATGGFNFTAPQQPQNPSSGLFQFGASSNTQPSQPFQFNAAQPSSAGFTAGFSPGVGGTGQQMFSIGSGSTAPRRVTARRKK